MLKKLFKEQNIVRLNLLGLLLIIGLLSLSMGYLFISSYYKDFIVEFDKIKNDYIYIQKEKIKNLIDLELEDFSLQNDRISGHLRNELKRKTYSAHKIAKVIADTYSQQKSDQEIKQIIIDSIQSIRREEDFTCYWVNQYGHVITLARNDAIKSEIVFSDFADKEGLALLKKISVKTSTQSELYFDYEKRLPPDSKDKADSGLVFLKHFERYNWYVGFGILHKDIEKHVKREILDGLKQYQDEPDFKINFEIYELINGEKTGLGVLMDNHHPELVGSVLNINTKDARGNPYLRELFNKTPNETEEFIEIWESKVDSSESVRKLMYYRHYARWNWLIAKSFYPDSIEGLKTQKKIEALQKNIINKIIYLTALFLFFITIAITISVAFSRRIGKIFQEYKSEVDDRSRMVAEKNSQLSKEIFEKAMIENSLRKSEDRLRQLASEVQLTEERERRQIAGDLHDSIGSTLAISNLKIELLSKKLKKSETIHDLTTVHQMIKEVIQQTRYLTFQLSPPVLYEMGLEAALSGLIEETERLHHLQTDFEDDHQEKYLEEDVRIHLFRSVRELIINIIKHADASKLKVMIRKVKSQIQIDVVDDGKGFELTEESISPDEKGGFGLFSIRERLRLLGGQLEIKSVLEEGTHVSIKAPLKNVLTTDSPE